MYENKPLATVVKKIDLKDHGQVLLLDANEMSKDLINRNMVLVNRNEKIEWYIEPIKEAKIDKEAYAHWTNIWLSEENELMAYNYSGWVVHVSIEDGSLLKITYTK